MKLSIVLLNSFKKDIKRIRRRNLNLDLLDEVVEKLAKQERLEEKYRDHALTGNLVGFRECHIQPDWLLIYRVDGNDLVLVLSRTGTHSDLFNK